MLYYDSVLAYESRFDKDKLFRSRSDAINYDLRRAIEIVAIGSPSPTTELATQARRPRLLEEAARTHTGRVYEALDFLMKCRWELEAMETPSEAPVPPPMPPDTE
jgi:hypothetical protein